MGKYNTKIRGIRFPFPSGTVAGRLDAGTGDAFPIEIEEVLATGRAVRGPSGATDNALARFDGTTGLVIQGSSAILTDAGKLTVSELDTANAIITGGTITGITDLAVADGGTGASDAAGARTNLGLVIGTNIQAWDADLDALAALSPTGIPARTAANTWALRTLTASTGISISNGDGVSGNPTISSTITQYTDEMAQDAVGTILSSSGGVSFSYNDAGNTITAGYNNASIDLATKVTNQLPIANGGTNANTASGARTSLGLAIGTNVEAWDADLDAIAALTPSNDDIIQRKAGAWTNRTIAQFLTDLPLSESTWTPGFQGSSTAGSPTYGTRAGFHFVLPFGILFVFRLEVTNNSTAAGNIEITGLPATSENTASKFGWCSLFNISRMGNSATYGHSGGIIQPNETKIRLHEWSSTNTVSEQAQPVGTTNPTWEIFGWGFYWT